MPPATTKLHLSGGAADTVDLEVDQRVTFRASGVVRKTGLAHQPEEQPPRPFANIAVDGITHLEAHPL